MSGRPLWRREAHAATKDPGAAVSSRLGLGLLPWVVMGSGGGGGRCRVIFQERRAQQTSALAAALLKCSFYAAGQCPLALC